MIGGDERPDDRLVKTAEGIVRSGEGFLGAIDAFLDKSSRGAGPPLDKEILGLRIEDVMVAWQEQPNDALIFFAGGQDYRLWRCCYANGVLASLTFDD